MNSTAWSHEARAHAVTETSSRSRNLTLRIADNTSSMVLGANPTPSTLKAFQVSLVEPVAYRFELRASLLSPRLVCPFCETDKHDRFLVYYIAGRELERVEACNECRRYVLTIDLRGRAEEPVLEVAAVGLVHLDVLAQQKGFLPAAWSAWNLVSSEDIASTPVGIAPRETRM